MAPSCVRGMQLLVYHAIPTPRRSLLGREYGVWRWSVDPVREAWAQIRNGWGFCQETVGLFARDGLAAARQTNGGDDNDDPQQCAQPGEERSLPASAQHLDAARLQPGCCRTGDEVVNRLHHQHRAHCAELPRECTSVW